MARPRLPRPFGRYRLLRVLGKGAQSTVYKAECPTNGLVAIKILRTLLARKPEAARYFERETELALELEHPHLVEAMDTGVVEGAPYLTMELLRGSLDEELRREERLAVRRAGLVMSQVLDALQAVHDAGAVHRDVKPSNILFDRRGHAKLADLGLARLVMAPGTPATKPGFASGSPAYLAPEAARGAQDLDNRCDLYAVGAVLFDCLTGAPPYSGPTIAAILRAHQSAPIPSVREFRPEIPAPMATLVTHLLAKRRDDRPSSADAARVRMLSALPESGVAGSEADS